MKIHQNEITGAYYEADKSDWLTIFFAILASLFLLSFGLTSMFIIADWIVGAENVTNTLADLVVRVRN